MVTTLLALVVLVGPPSTIETFRFGIRPVVGSACHYRFTVTGPARAGSEKAVITQDLRQTLHAVRKTAAGLEILLTTDTAHVMTVGDDGRLAPDREVGDAYVESGRLRLLGDAAGSAFKPTGEDDGTTATRLTILKSSGFGFVFRESPRKALAVGDSFTVPQDISSFEAAHKLLGSRIVRSGPPYEMRWVLKRIAKVGNRRQAVFVGLFDRRLQSVAQPGGKAPWDTMHMKIATTATYDVGTGMLVSLDSKMTTLSRSGKKVTRSWLGIHEVLTNPAALQARSKKG